MAMPPVFLAASGLCVTGTAGRVAPGVLTVAVGSGDAGLEDEVGLDDEVGLERDEVARPLEVGPQPDSSTTVANTAMDPMAFFMVMRHASGRDCPRP